EPHHTALFGSDCGPFLRLKAFVDHAGFRPWREGLQRLQEFNDAVLLMLREVLECLARVQPLASVSQGSLSHRRESSIVPVWWLISDSPQASRQEPAVATDELRRANRLIQIEQLLRAHITGI